jgi:hypothetical protein
VSPLSSGEECGGDDGETVQEEVEMVNILMPGGRKRAINYGISGVPTIVVNGKKKIVGVPRKKDLREPIEKAMEKKG